MTPASTLLFFFNFLDFKYLLSNAYERKTRGVKTARLLSISGFRAAARNRLLQAVGFDARVTQQQHCVIFATGHSGEAEAVGACAAGKTGTIIG